MPIPALIYFGGNDDYRVDRMARARFEKESGGAGEAGDDFSREILDGRVNNLSEADELLGQLRLASQTLSLFAGRKVIWLRDINFLHDSGVGKSAGFRERWPEWEEALSSVDPEGVLLIVSASPVDRRKVQTKFFEKQAGEAHLVGADSKHQEEDNLRFINEEADRLGIRIEPSAARMLLAKIPEASRLWVLELEKLAAYLGEPGATVTEELVRDMVGVFGDGDFFEAAEAFFSLDLNWTLAALDRHFFHESQPRPLIMSFLARNRLLIQLSALQEGGLLPAHARSLSKAQLESAARKAHPLLPADGPKSNFNIFTQNPWYLGRLFPTASRQKLRTWIQFQIEILRAFEATIDRPDEPLEIFRELAVRCLARG